jgi:hypothetical protein
VSDIGVPEEGIEITVGDLYKVLDKEVSLAELLEYPRMIPLIRGGRVIHVTSVLFDDSDLDAMIIFRNPDEGLMFSLTFGQVIREVFETHVHRLREYGRILDWFSDDRREEGDLLAGDYPVGLVNPEGLSVVLRGRRETPAGIMAVSAIVQKEDEAFQRLFIYYTESGEPSPEHADALMDALRDSL